MALVDSIYYIEPKYWGRSFWDTIDAIIATYDPLDQHNRKAVVAFFSSLSHLLPCSECQHHYQQYIQKHPIHKQVDTRLQLFKWVYQLRSEINTRNKSPNVSFQSYLQESEKKFHITLLQ